MKRIIIAGGCFWGVQEYYSRLKGVIKTEAGYANGNYANPRYEDLVNNTPTRIIATHAEAVAIDYDENIISLIDILQHMFRFIDPTILDQQGNDIGHQYRTGIYYIDELDKDTIKMFINKKQNDFAQPIVVEVEKSTGFYPAEEYHQDYLRKHPHGYCHVNLSLIKKEEMK
jgi:peptide-methionine (S)-S-oxide reductase